MKRKEGRGRPMKSDEIKVKAVLRDEVDIDKMAQALISIAKEVAEKKAVLSQPRGE